MSDLNEDRRRRVMDTLAGQMDDAATSEWQAMVRFVDAELAENAAFDATAVPDFVAKYRPRLAKLMNVPSPELRDMTARPATPIAESADLKAAFRK